MKMNIEDFEVGMNLNVRRMMHDLFNHNFTGHVISCNRGYVQVRDQDDDVWDCVPEQLTCSSDDIMHG